MKNEEFTTGNEKDMRAWMSIVISFSLIGGIMVLGFPVYCNEL